jgi:hypothetical protein
MNKTELFIKLDKYENQSLMFDDTYLAPSVYGLFLGLEFQMDVSSIFSVGDIITIDKTNKSINPWADGTQSIIGITASSIYPAPGKLVFTDRPLQTPISFTSNENGVIYQGDSISSDWSQVDLSDDVAFPITFNIADVREINNRNGAYSKTVVIPGTKDNNKVFKYIFDIQGVDNYDTRVRVKANVVVDTIPVLEGYLQLDTINCDNNEYWTYNCIIYGENANFSKNIDQNALLNSLDFSEFNHYKTLDAITQSWAGDYTNGYYYPLLDYNNGKNPIDTFSNNTAAQFSYINENFKPSIYVKQYWDKIFKLYGYTYESEFLNSEAFTNLIVPTNVKTIQNDDDWRYNSSFKAGLTSTFVRNVPSLSPVNLPVSFQIANYDTITNTWPMSQSAPFFFDPQNVFITSTFLSPNFKYKNQYLGTIPKSQKITLNLDYKITPIGNSGINGLGFLLFYKIYKNGQLQYTRKVQSFGGDESTFGSSNYNNNVDYFNFHRTYVIDNFGEFDGYSNSSFVRRQMQVVYDTAIAGDLANNDVIEVRLGMALLGTNIVDITTFANYFSTSYQIDFYPSTNGYNGCYFYNFIDTNLLSRQPYRLDSSIPGNIKQIDFINSIIKMFNLYLNQDKVDPKKIYIEPRDQFYSTDFVDWSRKLDISKDILQKPIVDRKKRVFMSYKEDKDLANTYYKSNFNEIYGQYEYLTGNEFDTSEQKVEIIFSPTPLLNRKQSDGLLDGRLVYTQILDPKGTINTENYNKVDSNIRILYKKNIELSGITFKIFDYQSYYTYDTYPYAGHLDDPTSPGLDLSFLEPLYLFYEWQNFGYTNNSLYKLYYEQFFEEVYGLESKHITAYVYLTPQDIIDFDYRKLIYLDSASSGTGGYFRVNKIEYDPFNKMSYKVELIKVLNNFKSKYNKKLVLDATIGSVGVALPNWGTGLVTAGNYTSGKDNVIAGVDNSVRSDLNIVGGIGNQVLVGGSNIVTGYRNNTIAENSGIISGGRTTIYGTGKYSNVIGGLSQSLSGRYSNIIGGCNNTILINSYNNQILGGCNNIVGYNITGTTSVSQTTNSLILGGINNKIEVGPTESATDNVFILGGQNNTIAGGVTNSFILGGENFTATQSNTIYLQGSVVVNGIDISSGSTPIPVDEIAFGTGTGITSSTELKFNPTTKSSIIGGICNTLSSSNKASVVGGQFNSLSCYSNYSSIMGGNCNIVYKSGLSSIIGGQFNSLSCYSNYSLIMGGNCNILDSSCGSAIIGGNCNNLSISSCNSSIIGGSYNCIYQSCYSSMIGGVGNILDNNSCRSVILGGLGLTLSNESNVVLVPTLKIATASNTSASRILVWDTDNYVKYRDVSTIGGGGSGSTPISVDEIAFGTGTGITSSLFLKFNSSYRNLISADNSQVNCSPNSSIIGGQINIISYYSQDSSIIGGVCNIIATYSQGNSVIGGIFNCIINSTIESSIVGGRCNTLSLMAFSSIIGGYKNTSSCYSNMSSIIGGTLNTISCYSQYGIILGGSTNNITKYAVRSSIIGGGNNTLDASNVSSIIGGNCNTLCYTNNSSILGGSDNTMCWLSNNSSIIGGCYNTIATQSSVSSIIGGCNNILDNNSCGSVILGGIGLTLSNECNVVLVPTLKIATASNVSADRILVWDTDNYVKYRDVSTIGGGSGPAITLDEIAFGTGTGITSSTELKFNSTTKSSIIGGQYNVVFNSVRTSIIGGCNNTIATASCNSSIIGGNDNIINSLIGVSIIGGISNIVSSQSYYSSIVGGKFNTLSCSRSSSIIGGQCNNSLSSYSSIIAGQCNKNYNNFASSVLAGRINIICDNSNYSSIIGGHCNRICSTSRASSIVGGYRNILNISSCNSSIIGGRSNTLNGTSSNSSIVGGRSNTLNGTSNYSSITGGYNNKLCNLSNYSSIVGGINNIIATSSNGSSILGGCNNILSFSCNSAIIGGSNLSLTASNTILVPNLKVNDDISFINVSGLQAVSGGGPVTISTSYIKTASKVFLTGMNGASDAWYVDNIVNGMSFDITALTTGGTGDVAWLIIN